MPMLPGMGGNEDEDEEVLYVSIMVQPRDDLPLKEWQVEIEANKTIKHLKETVSEEYLVEPEIQKLCTTQNSTDPGLKDSVRVSDLPNHTEHTDVKKVFLLAAKAKDREAFLDRVLDWAFRAEVLEEYEAKGCVYRPPQEDNGEPEPVPEKRKSIMDKIAPKAMEAMTKKVKKPKKQKKPSSAQMGTFSQDGDKLTMEDPIPPMVDRMPFNMACSCLCAVNVLVVGFEADYTCWGLKNCLPADRMTWYAVDCIFTVIFVVEVALRIAQHGIVHYFLGDSLTTTFGFHIPNTIDFCIVFARFLDTFAFEQAGIDTKIKIISCIRIMQFARVARLMRLVKSVRELWLIVAGLADLCKTVIWVMILLLLIFWIIGIVMTIIIGHDDEFFNYAKSDWGKEAYFDTVPKSVFSLMQIMTLSQWSSVLIRPVFEQYPAIFLLVVPFLCITTVGLLNIIVGVVVETTLLSAANNAEKEAKETAKMHARVMESLKMVFEEADTDGGGTLDKEELHKSLKKAHVRDRLKVLDIPIKDLDQLFDVLDEEKLGEIRTDHFFRGCSRLRGAALACDLHRMSVDFSRYIQWTGDLVDSTKSTNDRLRSLLRDMESVDRDIIKDESDEFDPVLGIRRDRSMKKKNAQDNNSNLRMETKQSKPSSSGSKNKRKSLMAQTLTTNF